MLVRRGWLAVVAALAAGALVAPVVAPARTASSGRLATAATSVRASSVAGVTVRVAPRACSARIVLVVDGRTRRARVLGAGPVRMWHVALALPSGPHRITVRARARSLRCAAPRIRIETRAAAAGAHVQPPATTLAARPPAASASGGSQKGSIPEGAAPEPAGQGGAVPSVSTATASDSNPLVGRPFRVDPGTKAAQAAVDLAAQGRLGDAAAVRDIAGTPTARWFGDWNGTNPSTAVDQYVDGAAAAGQLPILVAYDIPGRDCGQYSAGGAGSAAAYRGWIDGMAAGIAGRAAAVIVEPDALAGLDCRDAAGQEQTLLLLAYAVQQLSVGATTVYLDAGNSGWHSASVMAGRLLSAGVQQTRGFALNVANFKTTASELDYGRAIAAQIPGAHFVIDTSRNGAGPAPEGAWCNPPGRLLGQRPTAFPGSPDVDAVLWIKHPGESDGQCNGGPAAGRFWVDYALELTRTA